MNKSEEDNSFTILDWIGILYAAAFIVGLFGFPCIALRFNEMFIDFGGTLPRLTEVVIKPWLSILLGIICLGMFSLQWLKAIKRNKRRRRTVLIFSFLAASTALATCIIGLYLPIFKIVGRV